MTASSTAWTAASAAAASLPYLLLKAYWSLGGTAGITSGQPLELGVLAGWGTVLISLLGTVGCAGLALLAAGRGSFPRGIAILGGGRVPRPFVLLPGWAGAILLIATGLAGTILFLRELVGGLADTEFALWVGPLVYGGWLVWGCAWHGPVPLSTDDPSASDDGTELERGGPYGASGGCGGRLLPGTLSPTRHGLR